jgi:diguanylate cyclase (GGDEF)-like protein
MALASAIAGERRGADVAARFGGDEFVLVLPQTESVSAANLADRISQRFENEVHRLHPGITPTLSIGAASLRTTRARSSESLIHEADLALYAAKQGGRNRLMEASSVD